MKLNSKKAICLMVALSLSTSNLPLLAKDNGWQQTNGVWSYIDNQGSIAKGWQLIDTSWYVFDTNGNMQTGWVAESENWYFLGGSGVMQSNTWIENTDGSKNFIKGTGIMAADYVKDGYEFLEDGTAVPLGTTGSVMLTNASDLVGTTITGNLYVDAKTANDLIISGVTITGKLVILGDNQSKTKITIVDSNINTISSQQRNSEIVLSGKTAVQNIVLQETALVVPDNTFKGQVEKFEIQSTTKGEVIVGIPSKEVSSRTYASVDIQAPVEKLEIKNDTNLKINADVSEIKVNASATGTKVEVNEGNTVGKIDTDSKIEVSGQGKVDEVIGAGKDDTTNVTPPEKPTTGGGGGGGGGNTGSTAVDVTGITLDTTSKVLDNFEESFDLVATVLPNNATNKKIKWSSSNNEVAMVDENGKVTALSFGKATITATTLNGSKTASCEVIVGTALVSIEVTGLDEVYVGNEITLGTTLDPTEPSDKTIEWESSDKKIATVNSNGVVKALKAGTVNIIATNNAYGISGTKAITVKQYVEEIEFTNNVESLLVNGTITLNPKVTPEDATSKDLIYTSSDETVATVAEDGTVTAKAIGTAIITAAAKDGSNKSVTCTINVVEPVAKIGEVNYSTLEKALESAETGDKVILIDKGYTMQSDAEVDKGVILVLPCKDNDTGYDVEKKFNPESEIKTNNKYAEILTTAYSYLTIPNGVVLTVSGVLIVNAETGIRVGGAYHPNSNHNEKYAQIKLDGDIIVGNGGILECPGFIKGNGTVTAQSGSTINDIMDIFNWRGGSYAYAAYYGRSDYAVYPIMESSISNIETVIILEGMAKFAGMARIYATLFGDFGYYSTARFVQFGEIGLIKTTADTKITKKVDTLKEMDKTFNQNDYNYSTISIEGDATFASGEINVGAPVSTADYFYPLSGTLTIDLNNGTFTVSERMKMMTGSTINVKNGATMIINNDFAIFKQFKDPYDATRVGVDKDRDPAKLNLMGGSILEINKNFAGEIYIDESFTSVENKAIIKTGVDFKTNLKVYAIKNFSGKITAARITETDNGITPDTYIVDPNTEGGKFNLTLKPNSIYHCYYDEEGNLVVVPIKEDGVLLPTTEEPIITDDATSEETVPSEETTQPEESTQPEVETTQPEETTQPTEENETIE